MLPNRAVENTADGDSDSSFSVDDGEVDETSGIPQEKPGLHRRLGDDGLTKEKKSPFGAGKARVETKKSCVFTRKVLDASRFGRFGLAPCNTLLKFESTISHGLLTAFPTFKTPQSVVFGELSTSNYSLTWDVAIGDGIYFFAVFVFFGQQH